MEKFCWSARVSVEGWLYRRSRGNVLRHERKIYIRFFADSDYSISVNSDL